MIIIMKKIELLKLDAEICDAMSAPIAEPIKAGRTMASSKRVSVFIDLRYLIAAVAVPKKAANFEVPTTETGFSFGKASKSAGVWIKPPPPAMASIKPAKKRARKSRTIETVDSS
jgi:hypothetical protein